MKRNLSDYLSLLYETANYYNSNNRGYDPGSAVCVYYAPATKNACAVGRCLKPELLEETKVLRCSVFNLADDYNDMLHQEMSFEDMLQSKYQGYDINFWGMLQSFHDKAIHWYEEGLTSKGIEERNRMEMVLKAWFTTNQTVTLNHLDQNMNI